MGLDGMGDLDPPPIPSHQSMPPAHWIVAGRSASAAETAPLCQHLLVHFVVGHTAALTALATLTVAQAQAVPP